MRKRTVLPALMLAFLTLIALMPVVKATTYYWDAVRFVEGVEGGIYIAYPHPDRDYYGISPYEGWRRAGNKLYHSQFDRATSVIIAVALPAIGAAVGAVVGAMIGGVYGVLYGAVIGGVTSAVLTVVLTWVPYEFFLDEYNCIWWWISISFADWLSDNAWWLGPQCIGNPSAAGKRPPCWQTSMTA